MSGLNDVYRELIFSKEVNEWFICHGKTPDQLVEEEFFSNVELNNLSRLSKSELLELAKKWSPSYSGSHKKGWHKTRKEDAKQKKIIAEIEDQTCQVCGFFCEYLNPKGRKLFVIHVDHIIEKSIAGDERLENLWVLCPNCHAKKTAGLIEIDLENRKIFESGVEITIRDSHLFV
jgi:5-methylcytosine-specific restriction protein A